jgi:hypothetical protein
MSDYGMDDRGSIPGRGKGFFFRLLCPDRLWGPPSLLYNGYRGVLSPGLKRGRGVKLITHPHLVSRMSRRQGRGVHVTGVSAAYTFKLNKNILSE